MIRPPPIQNAWQLDLSGRLISTPWILWLNDVMTNASSGDIGNADLLVAMLQPGLFVSTSVGTVSDAEMLTWLSM